MGIYSEQRGAYMKSDNVTKIKEAAYYVFSKKGYRETRIIDIARKAGISIGTIYTNFKDKKELFESLNLPQLEMYRPEYSKKRSKILKTALSVFMENGYDSTSMQQIASKCGFAKAVLYQYFKSKEELFSAAFEENTMLNGLDSIVTDYADENLEDVLVKIGMSFMKMFEDKGRLNLMRIVIAESLRFPKMGKIMYDNAINKVAEKFSKYLMLLSHDGIIKCDNPKLTARSYFGLLYSFVLTQKIINQGNIEFTNYEIVDYASKLFLTSLKL